MTMSTPLPNDSMSMFVSGKLRPGVYKVQNLTGQTFLEVLEDSKKLCCRPAAFLSPQDALWEFQASGSGYKIKKVDRGKPDQFCNPLGGPFFGFGSAVAATAFPAAWRVELADDIQYRGFGYVRIYWGSTNKALDLNWWGSNKDGTTVRLWDNIACDPWRIWKLIPVRVDDSSVGLDDQFDTLPKYSPKK